MILWFLPPKPSRVVNFSSQLLNDTKNLKSCLLIQVELLLSIWNDYRQEVQQEQPPKSRLPEPPAQRELLKAEIKFFIDSIHEKAKAHGRL